MNIGIVVAVEFSAFYRKFGEPLEVFEHGLLKVYKYKTENNTLFVGISHAGQIRSAIIATILIEKYDCKMIYNYGVVGALKEDMKAYDIYLVEKVCHTDRDTTLCDEGYVKGQYELFSDQYIAMDEDYIKKVSSYFPDLKRARLGSSDKFLEFKEQKLLMKEEYSVEICDMEGASLALVCHNYSIPLIMIKIVSDSLIGGAKEFVTTFEGASDQAVDLLSSILERI